MCFKILGHFVHLHIQSAIIPCNKIRHLRQRHPLLLVPHEPRHIKLQLSLPIASFLIVPAFSLFHFFHSYFTIVLEHNPLRLRSSLKPPLVLGAAANELPEAAFALFLRILQIIVLESRSGCFGKQLHRFGHHRIHHSLVVLLQKVQLQVIENHELYCQHPNIPLVLGRGEQLDRIGILAHAIR